MYDLSGLSVWQLSELAAEIDEHTRNAASMEECAQQIVTHLFNSFCDSDGNKGLALARCFKTHRYDALPTDLQEAARQSYQDSDDLSDAKCLVLLGTAGIEPAWNSRQRSTGHKVIPLPSPRMVARFPMISQVISQLGVDIKRVLRPSEDLVVELHERTYNVFYVPDAEGSPHIPAQEQFVKPYGIKSVVGFGGVLASGELFVFVLFARQFVDRSRADLFQPLAVTVKTDLLPFDFGEVFSRAQRPAPHR